MALPLVSRVEWSGEGLNSTRFASVMLCAMTPAAFATEHSVISKRTRQTVEVRNTIAAELCRIQAMATEGRKREEIIEEANDCFLYGWGIRDTVSRAEFPICSSNDSLPR